jgi:hypothetical protein
VLQSYQLYTKEQLLFMSGYYFIVNQKENCDFLVYSLATNLVNYRQYHCFSVNVSQTMFNFFKMFSDSHYKQHDSTVFLNIVRVPVRNNVTKRD